MNYRIHGFVVASSLSLPAPAIVSDAVDVTYRVALDMRSPLEGSHSRPDDPDDPSVVEHWQGDVMLAEFPGLATFELSQREVVLVADETGDADLIAHLFLDHVLPRVVALRGDVMLHASAAVGPSGRAHIFLGATGAGKSTLATALGISGWGLLHDDGIRVVEGSAGPLAMPGYAGVRLLPDAAAALLPGVEAGRPMAEGHAKRRFEVDGLLMRMADGPAPIAGLYLLERTDEQERSAVRLGFGDAMGVIAAHGFHLADEPAAISRQAFERSSALATAVDAWRLPLSNDLENLERTRDLLVIFDSVDSC